MTRALTVAFFVLIASFGCANAADTTNCSVTASWMSKTLYTNNGFQASGKSSEMTNVECNHDGWYVGLFGNAPLENWADGRAIPETDIRAGKRFSFAGLDWDVSAASYTFSIATQWFESGDGRMRVSHTFNLGNGFSLQPYAILDSQYNFTPIKHNATALAGGTVASLKLVDRWTANADFAFWDYLDGWTAGRGPIYSVSPSLGYAVTPKITVGPQATFTWGNWALPTGSTKPNSAFGLFGKAAF